MVTCAKILNGFPCGAPALSDSIYCRAHDDRPETIQARREASSRGGRNAHIPTAPSGLTVGVSSADAILTSLRDVAQAVADGRLDRSRASSLVYALTTATQARRVLHTEERLRKIERRLNLGGGRPGSRR
jgi:hypothetical protein